MNNTLLAIAAFGGVLMICRGVTTHEGGIIIGGSIIIAAALICKAMKR